MVERAGCGCRTPVALGTRDRWQVEAAVEKLQQEKNRLTWRAWREGGREGDPVMVATMPAAQPAVSNCLVIM